MYRLARIRATGIGPADARFDRPSPEQSPFEVNCLDAEGKPTDTLVWLENGGGKTVFLALLFHVLRPDQAPKIGGDGDGPHAGQRRRGAIDEYLLTGDVGHVLCEWVDPDSDLRLVTGMVAEKRGSGVTRSWYLLSVKDPAFHLDNLTFDADGRRIRPGAFIEQVQAISRYSTPAAGQNSSRASSRRRSIEFFEAKTQRNWLALLASHHLDPALFEYQALMNRSEGGAASLFRFRSSEQFLEFFLNLTMNPDSLAQLSETLARVAEKVADLPRKEAELTYCTTAAGLLEVLSSAYDAHVIAASEAASALSAAERLDDALDATLSKLNNAVSSAEDDVGTATTLQQDADRARREADQRLRALEIAAADARIATCAASEEDADEIAKDAALTATAWIRVSEVLRQGALQGECDALRSQLDKAAAPIRQRRDAALRALRVGLTADLAEVRQARRTTARRLSDLEETETRARQDHVTFTSVRDSAFSEAKLHDETVAAAETALETARSAGLIGITETPAQGAHRLADEVADAAAGVESARRARLDAVQALQVAEASFEEKREAQLNADSVANAAEARAESARSERVALTSHPLALELGRGEVDLELVGAELAHRAMEAATVHLSAAVRVEAQAEDDRRAATSLEADRLLPARREVEELCARLHAAHIASAVPGWRYLAQAVSQKHHDAIIATHPALVDGIAVADAELEAAKELLADAGPAGAIVLGSRSLLNDPPPGIASESWVVPPAPAMFDPAAADEALELVLDRLASVDERVKAHTTSERTARAFADALSVHIELWPPGTLEAATDLAVSRRAAAHRAVEEVGNARQARAATSDEAAHAEERVTASQGRLSTAERKSDAAERLANDTVAANAAAEKATDLRGRAELANTDTLAAERERSESAEQIRSEQESDLTNLQTETGLDTELRKLPDPGEADGDLSGYQAETSIAELRSRFESADRLLVETTSASEVARMLTRQEQALSEVTQVISGWPGDIAARTKQLSGLPIAADAASRASAESAAAATSERCNRVLTDARTELKFANTHRENLVAPDRSVDLGPLPSDPAALAELVARAETAALSARQERVAADETLSDAKQALSDIEARHTAVSSQRDALGAMLGERTPAPAEEIVGEAKDLVRPAIARLRQANDAANRADSARRSAAHAISVFSRDPRHATLTGELPNRLANEEPDRLAPEAAQLGAQVRLKADRLAEDIDHLGQYRDLLLDSLADAVSAANASLRRAQRQSVLPDGLGAWSQHPFLKLSLALPQDATELRARLRRYTNDLVEQATQTSLPQGADLVCRALLACTEREVTVEVLKPNKAQRLVYVPIADLAPLSGGMRATAAIALFCTLARIRAGNLGSNIGVGTLILDNPIGDASATFLVALQRLMAETSQIQLLYTTAVNDYDAIRLFPVVNRLTNESGKRSHLSYVVADPTFLKQLASGDADSALVTGTRLVRRRPVPLTFDVLAATAAALSDEDL